MGDPHIPHNWGRNPKETLSLRGRAVYGGVGLKMEPSQLPADPGQGLASLGSTGEMGINQEIPSGSVLAQGAWVSLHSEWIKDSSTSSHKWSSYLFSLAGTESQKFFYDPFLAPTPVVFGNLKQHPKFPRPNFSLWELQPDDVRLNIRCHWSSQARLCHQLPAAAPSHGVRCGPGRCHGHRPQGG